MGSTTTTIDCWVSLTSFASRLVQKIKIVICGGGRQCCTVGTFHRTANILVKHLNSDVEQTRRGIVLLIFLFT